MNEKIKRKAHVKQSFSLDFLERGTFTEYPKVVSGQNKKTPLTLLVKRVFYSLLFSDIYKNIDGNMLLV